MRALLLAGALALATMPASANIIANLGLDPSSATGNFSNSLGTSILPFDNEFLFRLDHPSNLTIASATNVFPTPSDFIVNFTGAVFAGTPAMPGAEVLGPDHATACPFTPSCQFLSGSAFLHAGNYFLEITGIASGSSGYGGNIATFAVPAPLAGAGIPGVLAGLGLLAFAMMRRHRDVAAS